MRTARTRTHTTGTTKAASTRKSGSTRTIGWLAGTQGSSECAWLSRTLRTGSRRQTGAWRAGHGLSGILALLLLPQALKDFGAWRYDRARHWLACERRPLRLTLLWLLRLLRSTWTRLLTGHHRALRNYRRTRCAGNNRRTAQICGHRLTRTGKNLSWQRGGRHRTGRNPCLLRACRVLRCRCAHGRRSWYCRRSVSGRPRGNWRVHAHHRRSRCWRRCNH